jgi:hypothetical protein
LGRTVVDLKRWAILAWQHISLKTLSTATIKSIGIDWTPLNIGIKIGYKIRYRWNP